MAALAGWDWAVIGLYFAGIAAVVWWSSRQQKSSAVSLPCRITHQASANRPPK